MEDLDFFLPVTVGQDRKPIHAYVFRAKLTTYAKLLDTQRSDTSSFITN